MEKELIQKYLAACRLAGMEPARVQLVETVLEGFAEYCEKQKQAKNEVERICAALRQGMI